MNEKKQKQKKTHTPKKDTEAGGYACVTWSFSVAYSEQDACVSRYDAMKCHGRYHYWIHAYTKFHDLQYIKFSAYYLYLITVIINNNNNNNNAFLYRIITTK